MIRIVIKTLAFRHAISSRQPPDETISVPVKVRVRVRARVRASMRASV